MPPLFRNKRQSSRWKLLFLFVLIGVSGFGGYKLYEKGNKVGCFPLSENLRSPDVIPYRSDRLQLIAVGDTGTGNEDQRKVAEGMAKVCEEHGCDFVLLLGDNFYPDGVQSIHDPQFDSKFEAVYAKIKKPFFAVLGNHDVKSDALSQTLYSLKSDTWRMPNYEYAFDFGAARFFGLNTNCPFAAERLRRKLDADDLTGTSDADRTAQKTLPAWTIAFGHHSVFSGGTHGDADLFTRLYWDWLLEGRIDLYLSGHNHHLAHLQHGKVVTDYIVSGAGGKHYRSADERAKLSDSAALSRFVFNDTGFVRLDITAKELQISFHDSTGKTVYEFTKIR